MFTIFDIIILTILFASSIMGFYRGMLYITINLLGFIASILLAMFLYSYVRIIFSGYIANDLVTSIGSGVVSYIFSLVVFTFLSSKIVFLFKEISCGIFDRSLGFLIGIIRGYIISLLIFGVVAVLGSRTYLNADKTEDIIYNLEKDKYPEWLKGSVTIPYLEKSLKFSISYVPKDFLDSIETLKDDKDVNQIDEIKKKKRNESKSVIEVPAEEVLQEGINEILPADGKDRLKNIPNSI